MYQVSQQVLDIKIHERRINSWKFVYILTKQCKSPFKLTNFFDKKFQNWRNLIFFTNFVQLYFRRMFRRCLQSFVFDAHFVLWMWATIQRVSQVPTFSPIPTRISHNLDGKIVDGSDGFRLLWYFTFHPWAQMFDANSCSTSMHSMELQGSSMSTICQRQYYVQWDLGIDFVTSWFQPSRLV